MATAKRIWMAAGMAAVISARALDGRRSLLWLERDAQDGFADAELGVVDKHGGADAFFLVKGAVGGVQVAQIDVSVAYLDDAVMARNLRVLQRDVRAFASDHDTRLG